MNDIHIHQFNVPVPYHKAWQTMHTFTENRHPDTVDELWLLEHPPVFTQGLAGKAEHILNSHNIPVVRTDRGGQVTYHAPGQLMAYLLLDIKRLGIGIRQLVRTIEQTVIDYLGSLDIVACGNTQAPGVYVNGAKICSIGLRVRRGYSYHGLALNVNTDLTPFSYINPCGFKGLTVTRIKDEGGTENITTVKTNIIPYFLNNFRYNQPIITTETHMENLLHL